MNRASPAPAQRATDKLIGLPARALTLWQPFAWLIANGHKRVENRPPGFSHKSFRGEFWIHAGTHDNAADFLSACELAERMGIKIPPLVGDTHFGCIVGRATITGIIPPGDSGVPWHFPDSWGFTIVNAHPVTPVKCRGYQGFWNVPADVLAKLSGAA